MLFQMVSHMTKFNASCRKKLTFKLSKKKKTPCILFKKKNPIIPLNALLNCPSNRLELEPKEIEFIS